MTEFLDENPQLFEAVKKDESIITDFINRYENYLKNYKSVGLIDNLKRKFGKQKFDITETTATGDIITVVTDSENPKVGDSVTDENGKSLPDGEIVLKDGTTWEIKGGKIQNIQDADEDADNQPTTEPSSFDRKIDHITKAMDRLESSFAKSSRELNEAIEIISDEVSTFNRKYETLARTIKSKKFDKLDAEISGSRRSTSGFDFEKARELRAKQKNK